MKTAMEFLASMAVYAYLTLYAIQSAFSQL